MSELIVYNNNYQQFEFFLLTMFSLMYFCGKSLKFIKKDVARRKINPYTNWNILMILINYILNNCFNIYNIFISNFIAHNSLQIMFIFHSFLLYDKRILFLPVDTSPFILKYTFNNTISYKTLLQIEYLLANILVHILPVYYYGDLIIYNKYYDNNIPMYIYTILFKFMWILNISGNFNITSIYVPSFDLCNIKLINIVILGDYIVYKTSNSLSY